MTSIRPFGSSVGSAELKLRWAFRIFDTDMSGDINMDEMFGIVASFFDMEGEAQPDHIYDMAEEIFKALDLNGDGSLDEEEFTR